MSGARRLRLQIRGVDHQLRGVAYAEGRTWFVQGALLGEEVDAQVEQTKARIGFAKATQIHQASPLRQPSFCPHYGLCGGCSLQHLQPKAQLEQKQQAVLQQLQRMAGVKPEFIAQPLAAQTEAYRRQARLALKPPKSDLGFRQAQSQEIVDILQCPVLDARLQDLLPPLNAWIKGCKNLKPLGHLELLATEQGVAVMVTHDGSWSDAARQSFIALATQYQFSAFEQRLSEQPSLLYGAGLSYRLANLQLDCTPADFLQVHAELNQQMLAQALSWLAPKPDESGLDLFAGLGNFSLALARQCQRLTAVEVSADMVARLKANAERNAISNLSAFRADLMQPDWWQLPWARQSYDWALIDPPRAGAEQVAKQLKRLKLKRLLYVSCEPSTLARDVKILAASGFRLQRFGVIDMFAHTAHIETMLLLVKA